MLTIYQIPSCAFCKRLEILLGSKIWRDPVKPGWQAQQWSPHEKYTNNYTSDAKLGLIDVVSTGVAS